MTITDPRTITRGRRIRAAEPLHGQIVEHLEDEATCLDDNDLMGWLAYLADDITYRAPVRVTRDNGEAAFEPEMAHFDENAMTLFLKLMRMSQTASAWAENPASRTRRLVSNVRVYESDQPDEFHVESTIVVLRSRYDEPDYSLLSGRRLDLLRKVDDTFKLASRTIYFDQSTLGMQNLAIYV